MIGRWTGYDISLFFFFFNYSSFFLFFNILLVAAFAIAQV